jgi:outer membrane protein assembly factor BamD
MFRAKLSVPAWIALSAAALLAAGCSSTSVDKTANWSPNKIYSEAKDEAGSGAYDKAVPLYEKLEGRAAGTRSPSRPSSKRPTPSTSRAKRRTPSPPSTAS